LKNGSAVISTLPTIDVHEDQVDLRRARVKNPTAQADSHGFRWQTILNVPAE